MKGDMPTNIRNKPKRYEFNRFAHDISYQFDIMYNNLETEYND